LPDEWTAFELTAVLRFTELVPSIDDLRKRGIKATAGDKFVLYWMVIFD
jgi:hypothetical protein